MAIPTVQLLTLIPATASEGIVFSTSPSRANGSNGVDYFVKGADDAAVAFAEMAGCLLAAKVGLPAPAVAVCTFANQRYCGSQKAGDFGRNIQPLLSNRSAVENFDDLFKAIVVDAWLANTDRNMGNVVAAASQNGKMKLVFIDFEKSAALGSNPIMNSGMVEAARLWPTEDLGRGLQPHCPLTPPADTIGRIGELAETDLLELLTEPAEAFGVDWHENCAFALAKRAAKIAEIAEEVWSKR